MEIFKINRHIILIIFFLLSLSVTLYISHFFVYWTYTQIFRYILELENHNSFENTQFIESNSSIYLIKIILSFITTYFVSIQLYNKFEKRFI